MNKIAACLLSDGKAEQATAFYRSIFPDTALHEASRYGEGPGRFVGIAVRPRACTCDAGHDGHAQIDLAQIRAAADRRDGRPAAQAMFCRTGLAGDCLP